MRILKQTLAASLFVIVAAQSATAGAASQHSSQAVAHSGMAVSHGVVASVQAVSVAAAIPLAAVGAVGEMSQQSSEALLDFANTPMGGPLPISKETFTAGPSPKQMIQERGNK